MNLAIVGDAAIVLDSEGRELSRSSFEAAQAPFSAALSEDGSHYALILEDQSYTVRVSATSKEIIRGHCASVSLEVGNNGTVLLGFGEGYQAPRREKRAVDYREIDQEMRLSTDGRYILTKKPSELVITDVETNAVVHAMPVKDLRMVESHENLVYLHRDSQPGIVFDLSDMKVKSTIPSFGEETSAAFPENGGSVLIYSEDKQAALWDTESARLIGRFKPDLPVELKPLVTKTHIIFASREKVQAMPIPTKR